MDKNELMSVELSDEMKALVSSVVATKNAKDTNIQYGRNNFNNVDTVNVISQNTNNKLKASIAGYIEDFSEEYYNLIIINGEFLNEDCINIKIQNSVAIKTDYGTKPKIYDLFKKLDKKIQKQIKDFPTLIIDKGALNSTVSDIYAIICKITNIKCNLDGSINFTLVKVKDKPYSKEFLLKNATALDINLSKGITELDEVHWAIKKSDLKSIFNLEGVI